MAFEFLHFNSFNNFGNTNFFGFGMPQLFSMPMTFRMPTVFSLPVLQPVFPAFTRQTPAPNPEIKSLYKEDIYNELYPQTTGTRFDSSNFMNLNIMDIPLDGFQPVNYVIEPMKFNLPSFNLLTVSKTKNKSNYSLAPKTNTTITEVEKIYNKEKGKKLAQETIDGLKYAQKGYCARAVKTGIEKAGLGSYQSGDAYQMPSILRQNANFKEVKVKSEDLDKLPAGCIICYAPGDCNYDSRFGHVETTDGNGNAISFFVNNNIKKSDNVRVFVPV